MTENAVAPTQRDYPACYRDLGTTTYESVWRSMRDFTDTRTAETPDEVWSTQHQPVFTQGRAGKPEHLLVIPTLGDINQIPVVQSDRGGQVTYHGPGQLVVYPLLDLKRRKLGVRDLVTCLEQSAVAFFADLGIDSTPRADAPGVYVGERKIASLGLRVRHGCTLHGIALNLNMDLRPFSRINPCGYAGLTMTQVRDELAPGTVLPPWQELENRYLESLARQLDIVWVERPSPYATTLD